MGNGLNVREMAYVCGTWLSTWAMTQLYGKQVGHGLSMCQTTWIYGKCLQYVGNGLDVWDCLFVVGCLTSKQHASVSQGRICTDSFTCCHTEIEVADQTFHLTQSRYTDTGPTSPSADPITPVTRKGSHWSANV